MRNGSSFRMAYLVVGIACGLGAGGAFAAEAADSKNASTEWMALWESVARDHSLQPIRIREISKIIEDAHHFACAPPLDAKDRSAYKASLERYFEVQEVYLKSTHEPYWRGAGYMLAYCIAEAATREPIAQEEVAELEQNLRETAETLADCLRSKLLARVPEEKQGEARPTIHKAVNKFEQDLVKRIQIFRKDLLYFAPHKPIPREVVTTLCDQSFHQSEMPAYEVTERRGRKPPKPYNERLQDQMRSITELTLFEVFIRSLKPHVLKNEYWGYMEWSATTPVDVADPRCWPGMVNIRPNEAQNRYENWERGERPCEQDGESSTPQ